RNGRTGRAGRPPPRGAPRLCELDRRLLALNASPGGAADLLAACLFLDRLPAVSGGWAGSL
ncbi:triphosphoribosyl-dephospho-CoA synthase, partial [Pseudomonas aeruginosa]|uniref:triphosphoribosyl-dephospho-CoA synthase n=1 Tax=Pseudomonas aeruginosa TaxID=287 RepID=UPI00053B38A9